MKKVLTLSMVLLTALSLTAVSCGMAAWAPPTSLSISGKAMLVSRLVRSSAALGEGKLHSMTGRAFNAPDTLPLTGAIDERIHHLGHNGNEIAHRHSSALHRYGRTSQSH